MTTGKDPKRFDIPEEIAWCPGCGNFNILGSLKKALHELELDPHEVVVVSGIGQAAKTPQYINANGFNGLHGRALPPALAIKIANKNLKVVIDSGDGDSYGEGGNHLLHNIRRNIDIAHFIHDNMIYGLTKGQGSPTTEPGQKTSMQVDGVITQQFNPLAFALSAGAGFVARAFSGDPEHLVEIMKEAIRFKGYAMVDIFQPCVAFNHVNTFKWYKDRVYRLDDSYDPSDKEAAFRKAYEWGDRIPVGVIYKKEYETFTDRIPQLDGAPLVDRKWEPRQAAKYMEAFR